MMRRATPTRRAVLGALAAGLGAGSLGGCAGLRDPATKLVLDIEADPQINLNELGQPSPIVIRFYELKSLANFSKSEFFDLFDNDAKALGSDLVNRREFEVKPGAVVHVEDTIGSEARFVAIVAGFRDQQNAVWRDQREIVTESTNRLVIKVTALSVNFAVGKYQIF